MFDQGLSSHDIVLFQGRYLQIWPLSVLVFNKRIQYAQVTSNFDKFSNIYVIIHAN